MIDLNIKHLASETFTRSDVVSILLGTTFVIVIITVLLLILARLTNDSDRESKLFRYRHAIATVSSIIVTILLTVVMILQFLS